MLTSTDALFSIQNNYVLPLHKEGNEDVFGEAAGVAPASQGHAGTKELRLFGQTCR